MEKADFNNIFLVVKNDIRYRDNNGVITRVGLLWYNMMQRCYSDDVHKNRPTYKNCKVSENFKDFNYFINWCEHQVGFNDENFELDKDILFRGNKLYSENTCVFVPQEVNTFFTRLGVKRGILPVGVDFHKNLGKFRARMNKGKQKIHIGYFSTVESAFDAYCIEKENYARILANKYATQMDKRVVDVLLSFKVAV